MTKLIALAAALAAFALTGAASAANTFSVDRAGSTASSLSLTDVQADQAGRVEIYAFDGHDVGPFLGSVPVSAGTTASVDVALDRVSDGRVLVVMMNGNHSVAKLDIREAPIT